ncbi:hypothetical protein GIY56_04335 [Paracoccus sp. YIM 132242]|uniref:PepSY domain-containing protein n=1 Tax=Paracoccus lichenicola TaxID=2665644 RepID=A0A6L6HMV4_9RHOB|nr:hypothetical protein [Paracoccus lichenicola]MTD99512.1 hypothetical protein [Paracoccus lichenicola]
MVMRKFTTSAAMLALIAGLGTTAMAQTAPAATDLPAPLAGLNLNNLRMETKRDGIREVDGRTTEGVDIEARIDMAGNLVEVEADGGVLPQTLVDAMVPADLRGQPVMTLFGSITEINQRPEHVEITGRQPTGAEIEALFDRQNTLVGVEVDDAAIPADLVATLLPQAVQGNEVIGQFDRIEQIMARDGRVMVEGEDANGEDMRAEFDQDGRVLRFGREEGRGPERDRPGEERRGDRGPGKHHEHGPRSAGHGPGDHGPRGEGPRGADARGPVPVPADFDAVAVNQALTQAGYKDFGFLRAEGPRLMLEATNPQGEPVTLELDPRGEVIRETAR